MKRIMFTESVGVAPGTTTIGLGRALGNPFPFPERAGFYPTGDPWGRYNRYTPPPQWQLGEIPAARIRWDIIGVVGGGSLAIALAIGLIASALSK